uniref:Uncharacterized protein n=1 Tax=Heterorhabditis bacteriophora TaxID=37862 RepID=A0A1I7WND3_HETBA
MSDLLTVSIKFVELYFYPSFTCNIRDKVFIQASIKSSIIFPEYYYFDYHCVLITSAQFELDEEEYSDYNMGNLVSTLDYKNMTSFPRDRHMLTKSIIKLREHKKERKKGLGRKKNKNKENGFLYKFVIFCYNYKFVSLKKL